MITCFITYDLDPARLDDFERYAAKWERIVPECGASMVGCFLPHEGSLATAYGVCAVRSLRAYEEYRARLASHPAAIENFRLARERRIIRREERLFCRRVAVNSAHEARS